VFGAGRVGLKISPIGRNGDMFDSDPEKVFTYLLEELSKRKVAFVELKDDFDPENFQNCGYPSSKSQIADVYKTFRKAFSGIIIANNSLTPETARERIVAGDFECATFGKLFISSSFDFTHLS
jgi:2,4-dienoyl-CoA reductase-like NADH-dependent reductase (Old Yellow Enzyme family)